MLSRGRFLKRSSKDVAHNWLHMENSYKNYITLLTAVTTRDSGRKCSAFIFSFYPFCLQAFYQEILSLFQKLFPPSSFPDCYSPSGTQGVLPSSVVTFRPCNSCSWPLLLLYLLHPLYSPPAPNWQAPGTPRRVLDIAVNWMNKFFHLPKSFSPTLLLDLPERGSTHNPALPVCAAQALLSAVFQLTLCLWAGWDALFSSF